MKMTQFANFANDATKQILGTSGLIRENLQSMFSYPDAINVLDPVTVSGNLIQIEDGAPLNAKCATVYIESLQEGSGVPSPDNIRSISGWAGANIARYGVNIWDEQWENGRITNGVNSSGAGIRSKNHIIIKPNTQYRLIKDIEKYTGNLWVTYYNKDGQRIYDSEHANGAGWSTYTNGIITTIPNAYSMRFFVVNATEYTGGISFNYPSSNTNLHSGDENHVYHIIFPAEIGTVYGGILNVTNGLLIVDKVAFNSALANWELNGINGVYIKNFVTLFGADSNYKPIANYLKSLDKSEPLIEWSCKYNTVGMNLLVKADGVADLSIEAWNEYITNNQLIIIYKLNTPITYQLTPTNILMLNGINTIYADCGSMELEYYRREGGGTPYV